MTINLFRDLNQEWSLTANSRRAAESLERWKSIEPVLAEFSDLSAIIDRAHDPDRSRRDDVMAALVRLGRQDRLAWRVVLHVVMPGMICTARRFSSGAHGQDEVAATVVTAAWERIAEYPLDRRPRNIGGNIALDTRQIASRRLFRHSGVEIPTEELAHYRAAPACGADPAVTLVRLLDRAVKRNLVSPADARLVALTRIQDVPVAELAAERGVLPHSLRRRRLRVEAALRAVA